MERSVQADKRAMHRRRVYLSCRITELFKERERVREEMKAAVPELQLTANRIAIKQLRYRISYLRQRWPLLHVEIKEVMAERKALLETMLGESPTGEA